MGRNFGARNQRFDVAIKQILNGAPATLRQIGASHVERWLNVELPSARNPRVDLLGRSASGGLEHFELQSRNEPGMALRMLDYGVAIARRYGRFPRQTLLYVGKGKPRMSTNYVAGGIRYRYTLLNFRDFDRKQLLNSEAPQDHVLAVLAGEPDASVVPDILSRLSKLPDEAGRTAVQALLLLSELRGLEGDVEEEIVRMPIVINLMEHKVFGPILRRKLKESEEKGLERGLERGLEQGLERGLEQGLERGLEQGLERGLEQGLEQGLERGRDEGARVVLRRLILKRFGKIPAWAEKRLNALSGHAIEELSVAVLDAPSLKDLFGLPQR